MQPWLPGVSVGLGTPPCSCCFGLGCAPLCRGSGGKGLVTDVGGSLCWITSSCKPVCFRALRGFRTVLDRWGAGGHWSGGSQRAAGLQLESGISPCTDCPCCWTVLLSFKLRTNLTEILLGSDKCLRTQLNYFLWLWGRELVRIIEGKSLSNPTLLWTQMWAVLGRCDVVETVVFF